MNTLSDEFYNFTPESAFNEIKDHWTVWDAKVNPKAYVIGISGGVDSSCVAALACKMFGKDRVVGVSLPCDGQSDMWAVDKLFASLGGIRRLTIDIGDMLSAGLHAVENQGIDVSSDTKINMPARLRMTMLYGIAQSINGVVVNTCNRSEDVVGYSTLYGDNAGSYAPIAKLTKTEVIELTRWLGLPKELVEKTPIDGLQPLTDEEKLGITYAKIDDFIRSTAEVPKKDKELILDKFAKNKFKLEIVKIPGPKFELYPDKIRDMFKI